MPKKKRKPAKRSKFAAALQTAVGSTFKVLFRFVPVAALSALIFIGFSRVRDVLYADPALGIREIKVTPENVLPPALQNELKNRWMGKNIFKADVDAVSEFLGRDPIVLKAETVKVFPSKLSIRLLQRTPFARIRFERDGQAAIISEDGMILGFEENWGNPFDGPVMEAFEAGWKKPVKGSLMAAKGYLRAVEFYKQFKTHPLSASETITRMSLDYLGNVTVTLGSGPEVKLGRRPLETMKNLQKIDPFLDPAERPKIQYVDLQFEDVIVKKRGK